MNSVFQVVSLSIKVFCAIQIYLVYNMLVIVIEAGFLHFYPAHVLPLYKIQLLHHPFLHQGFYMTFL